MKIPTLIATLALTSCATIERHPAATAFVIGLAAGAVIEHQHHEHRAPPAKSLDLCNGAPPFTLGCGGGI